MFYWILRVGKLSIKSSFNETKIYKWFPCTETLLSHQTLYTRWKTDRQLSHYPPKNHWLRYTTYPNAQQGPRKAILRWTIINRRSFFLLQMEDEGNHGNDDTRCFILSTLAALQWSRVSCVLCRAAMLVFDRYPLVDGTFFLSPRQHSASCAEVRAMFILQNI